MFFEGFSFVSRKMKYSGIVLGLFLVVSYAWAGIVISPDGEGKLKYKDNKYNITSNYKTVCTYECEDSICYIPNLNRKCTHYIFDTNNRLQVEDIKLDISGNAKNIKISKGIKDINEIFYVKDGEELVEDNKELVEDNKDVVVIEFDYFGVGEEYNIEIGDKEIILDPEISICGSLANANSVYILTQDIVSTSGVVDSACFRFAANNITFDCNSHYIDIATVNLMFKIIGVSANIQNCDMRDINIGTIQMTAMESTDYVNISNNIFGLLSHASQAFYFEGDTLNLEIFDNSFNTVVPLLYNNLEWNSNIIKVYNNNISIANTGIFSGMGYNANYRFYNNIFNITNDIDIFGYDKNNTQFDYNGVGNIWYNSTEGYSISCVDVEGDGICDNAFNVNVYGSADNYPQCSTTTTTSTTTTSTTTTIIVESNFNDITEIVIDMGGLLTAFIVLIFPIIILSIYFVIGDGVINMIDEILGRFKK